MILADINESWPIDKPNLGAESHQNFWRCAKPRPFGIKTLSLKKNTWDSTSTSTPLRYEHVTILTTVMWRVLTSATILGRDQIYGRKCLTNRKRRKLSVFEICFRPTAVERQAKYLVHDQLKSAMAMICQALEIKWPTQQFVSRIYRSGIPYLREWYVTQMTPPHGGFIVTQPRW